MRLSLSSHAVEPTKKPLPKSGIKQSAPAKKVGLGAKVERSVEDSLLLLSLSSHSVEPTKPLAPDGRIKQPAPAKKAAVVGQKRLGHEVNPATARLISDLIDRKKRRLAAKAAEDLAYSRGSRELAGEDLAIDEAYSSAYGFLETNFTFCDSSTSVTKSEYYTGTALNRFVIINFPAIDRVCFRIRLDGVFSECTVTVGLAYVLKVHSPQDLVDVVTALDSMPLWCTYLEKRARDECKICPEIVKVQANEQEERGLLLSLLECPAYRRFEGGTIVLESLPYDTHGTKPCIERFFQSMGPSDRRVSSVTGEIHEWDFFCCGIMVRVTRAHAFDDGGGCNVVVRGFGKNYLDRYMFVRKSSVELFFERFLDLEIVKLRRLMNGGDLGFSVFRFPSGSGPLSALRSVLGSPCEVCPSSRHWYMRYGRDGDVQGACSVSYGGAGVEFSFRSDEVSVVPQCHVFSEYGCFEYFLQHMLNLDYVAPQYREFFEGSEFSENGRRTNRRRIHY
jgi:hypothetical protein